MSYDNLLSGFKYDRVLQIYTKLLNEEAERIGKTSSNLPVQALNPC